MILKDFVKEIKAREIYTSRSTLTVEVEFCMEGFSIFSSVPSGKSTGSLEAKVISGEGGTVKEVVDNIIKHSEMIIKTEMCSPDIFDGFLISLDGTKIKSKLGANFILPLSICFRKLVAYVNKEPVWKQFSKGRDENSKINIPAAHFNILNGGMHSGNGLDCQEVMVCFERTSFSEQMKCAVGFYEALGKNISSLYGSIYTSVGDEGGFCPPIKNMDEALNLVMSAGCLSGIPDFKIALDVAANSFYLGNGKYKFDGVEYNGRELASVYEHLTTKFPIYSIEDPFAENDYDSWEYFYSKMGQKINIVADDLTVTNAELISKLYKKKMFNTVLIKPNQIGSVVETVRAVDLCKELGMKVMVSHRSAETEDTFISNLAVGVGADYIKAGAPCRGERISKYNELLRIEESLSRSSN